MTKVPEERESLRDSTIRIYTYYAQAILEFPSHYDHEEQEPITDWALFLIVDVDNTASDGLEHIVISH